MTSRPGSQEEGGFGDSVGVGSSKDWRLDPGVGGSALNTHSPCVCDEGTFGRLLGSRRWCSKPRGVLVTLTRCTPQESWCQEAPGPQNLLPRPTQLGHRSGPTPTRVKCVRRFWKEHGVGSCSQHPG
jgi:hypothetical protein